MAWYRSKPAPKTLAAKLEWNSIIKQLSKDPNWNGGWYYDKGGILTALPRCALQR